MIFYADDTFLNMIEHHSFFSPLKLVMNAEKSKCLPATYTLSGTETKFHPASKQNEE